MPRPRAILADDERLMRDQLRARLREAWPELDLVGEAKNGDEALSLVASLRPDLAFLDIRMPGQTGLEVARTIAGCCQIVFVTAFDAHAVEAFERGAIDYLLKPVDGARLALTVERLKNRLTAANTREDALARIEAMISGLAEGGPARRDAPHLRWIQAGVGNRLQLYPVEEVIYLQAQDKYTVVVTADGDSLVRKPIREFAEALDPEVFWQIHRSTIVNSRAIAAFRREGERAEVLLRGRNETLEVSRSYAGRFRQM
ncbi:MAG TPA: LytTR family DNA-binding domain-containing protein [Rhodocyclaceae bacterium]|nr:LytTR family DNA-binding domain-containing protein [Rhodocyclaceae bacterium]